MSIRIREGCAKEGGCCRVSYVSEGDEEGYVGNRGSARLDIADHLFYSTLIPLEIWDCPGTTTAENLGSPLSQFNALIFVIDMRVRAASPI